MEPNKKRYNVLENILQQINAKYISLSESDTKRNNILLKEVMDQVIIQKMKAKDVLFNTMYQSKFYGGSFYDNLKVGEPSEFDLDCLLCLPKIIEPTIEITEKPGFVKVNLKQLDAMEKREEAPKYAGLKRLLDGSYLSTVKVLAWIESLAIHALNSLDNNTIVVKSEDKTYNVIVKVRKNGPALNFTLTGEYGEKKYSLDIDLVICFKFFEDQWPKNGYRKNPSNKNTFFVVPKSPKDFPTYFRLSFPEQERELMKSYSVLKSSVKLMKQIRDRNDHKIASYHIKTVFLWEVEKLDKEIWKNSLSYVFMMMLEKYAQYVKSGNIPFYWNKKNNMIENLHEKTYFGISNHLKRIKDDVDRNLTIDPFTIAKYLLRPEEVENLRGEVDLGKKFLKMISSSSENSDTLKDKSFEVVEDASSSSVNGSLENASSSSSSSFETLTKIQETNSKLLEMMEIMFKKIDSLEIKVNHLVEDTKELKSKLSKEAEKKNDHSPSIPFGFTLHPTDLIELGFGLPEHDSKSD